MKILVTGGAGFIGSNFLNLFVPRHPEHSFINLDKLTYAANPLNLKKIENAVNYNFTHGDLCDYEYLIGIFEEYNPDLVFHFAAESHVDRSIYGPAEFIRSNIVGTFNLLEACRNKWGAKEEKLLLHVSTDEVYGSLSKDGCFVETTAYDPSSPYSASKASSDHLVRAYHRTYGLKAAITNCSNNYGPYQFPEKLIPLMILNALSGKVLPVYGNGENVRDWLYVEDHCQALWAVFQKGRPGETYNIGGGNEWRNIDLVHQLCETLAAEVKKEPDFYKKLIQFVADRPGHDYRYAIDAAKIRAETGWEPRETFESGLEKTVRWYLSNEEWVESIKSGAYRKWIDTNYTNRFCT